LLSIEDITRDSEAVEHPQLGRGHRSAAQQRLKRLKRLLGP
jgi:hypothetical protein